MRIGWQSLHCFSTGPVGCEHGPALFSLHCSPLLTLHCSPRTAHSVLLSVYCRRMEAVSNCWCYRGGYGNRSGNRSGSRKQKEKIVGFTFNSTILLGAILGRPLIKGLPERLEPGSI